MIVTVTPNPSIDHTLELDRLVRGAVNRSSGGRVDPGGKGINVSRALRGHGIATAAVAPLGGVEGTRLAGLLADGGIEVRAVPIDGPTRTNVTVAEPAGTTTKLNEPGPLLTADEAQALRRTVLEAAGPTDWGVCCGSLPRGVGPGFFAALAAPLHDRGVRIALDTSGPALLAALTPSPRGPAGLPDLVKPNHEELAEAVARPLPTLGDVVRAARELRGRGIDTVLVSLGPDGAVLVDAAGAVHAEARVERPRSTVGAGDALLAGYLSVAARPEDPGRSPAGPVPLDAATAREALVAAVAWGAAATGLPGSRMPGPHDVAAVTVTVHDRCDPQRRLGGATE
ncbi:MAG: 1-phosphofructokinase [Actinomycetota bacterium]|nr:1-phosphofructokinase [Actinomycetota bacterium]